MTKKLLSIIALFLLMQLHAQRDTLALKEVKLNHIKAKKPKVRKINYGEGADILMPYDVYGQSNRVFHTLDSLPYGELQELTIAFTWRSQRMATERIKEFKVFETIYEANFYEADGYLKPARLLNEKPVVIHLEETKSNSLQKINLDLTPYHFSGERIILELKKITPTPCDFCYSYVPLTYKTQNAPMAILKADPGRQENDLQNLRPSKFCIVATIKTLTRDY